MSVGSKYAFLQWVTSQTGTVTTAGITLTIGATTTGLPVDSVRINNLSTATLFVGMGTGYTSSAQVTTGGLILAPTNQYGCSGVFRTGGALTIQAYTVGATQTTGIWVTGGEGLAS